LTDLKDEMRYTRWYKHTHTHTKWCTEKPNFYFTTGILSTECSVWFNDYKNEQQLLP